MPDQPTRTTLLLTCQHTCTIGAGKGVLVPEDEYRGPTCPSCQGVGIWDSRPVALAAALRSDPATRAALRAVLAEVCGELAELEPNPCYQPLSWQGAARVLGEEGG